MGLGQEEARAMHPSVQKMWREYQKSAGPKVELADTPVICSFSDSAAEIDELADLAARGIKRATSPSLWWFEATGEPMPRVGDLQIVVDSEGRAACVIRTTKVEVVPFAEISAEYAHVEGEGDKSLEHWKRVHWDYYHRELAGTGRTPTPEMPIVCEYFEPVYPRPQ